MTNQIDYVDQINAKQYEINRLYALRNNISSAISLLDNAYTSYDSIENYVNENYKVNDANSCVGNKIIKIKDSIYDKKNQLLNSVIPEIDRKIQWLKSGIYNLKQSSEDQ